MTPDNLDHRGDLDLFLQHLRRCRKKEPFLDPFYDDQTSFIRAVDGKFVVTTPKKKRIVVEADNDLLKIFENHKRFFNQLNIRRVI